MMGQRSRTSRGDSSSIVPAEAVLHLHPLRRLGEPIRPVEPQVAALAQPELLRPLREPVDRRGAQLHVHRLPPRGAHPAGVQLRRRPHAGEVGVDHHDAVVPHVGQVHRDGAPRQPRAHDQRPRDLHRPILPGRGGPGEGARGAGGRGPRKRGRRGGVGRAGNRRKNADDGPRDSPPDPDRHRADRPRRRGSGRPRHGRRDRIGADRDRPPRRHPRRHRRPQRHHRRRPRAGQRHREPERDPGGPDAHRPVRLERVDDPRHDRDVLLGRRLHRPVRGHPRRDRGAARHQRRRAGAGERDREPRPDPRGPDPERPLGRRGRRHRRRPARPGAASTRSARGTRSPASPPATAPAPTPSPPSTASRTRTSCRSGAPCGCRARCPPRAAAARPPARWRTCWAQHAARYGVDPSLARAIAWQESRWNQGARSHAGAIGVMQLMPVTARWLGRDVVGRPLDPHRLEDNIEGGVAYLRWLANRSRQRAPDDRRLLPGPPVARRHRPLRRHQGLRPERAGLPRAGCRADGGPSRTATGPARAAGLRARLALAVLRPRAVAQVDDAHGGDDASHDHPEAGGDDRADRHRDDRREDPHEAPPGGVRRLLQPGGRVDRRSGRLRASTATGRRSARTSPRTRPRTAPGPARGRGRRTSDRRRARPGRARAGPRR